MNCPWAESARADRAGVRTTHVCLLVLFQVTDVVYMKKHTSPKLVLGVCLGGKEQGGAEGRWGGVFVLHTCLLKMPFRTVWPEIPKISEPQRSMRSREDKQSVMVMKERRERWERAGEAETGRGTTLRRALYQWDRFVSLDLLEHMWEQPMGRGQLQLHGEVRKFQSPLREWIYVMEV